VKLQDLLKDIELGKVYTDKNRKPFKVNEDGHTDVPSAIRKLKLSIEDSQQILQKLESMDKESSLPAWWTDKVTLASNYLNKSRDYLLNSNLDEAGYMGGAIDMSGMHDSYIAPKRDTEKGGTQAFLQKFSSKEAKAVVDGGLKMWAKELRRVQYKVIKDWMSAAKSGKIDFFDIIRGLKTGDVSRAHQYETDFLVSVLTRDKIIDRFRKYFGGKKGKSGRRK
jgi:hypothetical protein